MNRVCTFTHLGDPDLKVAGFQLWVHERQFSESQDYYDGNWLCVTAHCGAAGASAWVQGAILTVIDIASFGERCAALLNGKTKSAALHPLEPELKLLLEAVDRLGHIRVRVDITPDTLVQAHHFEFEIDLSYLPGIIAQCSAIVRNYPIRGQRIGQGNQ